MGESGSGVLPMVKWTVSANPSRPSGSITDAESQRRRLGKRICSQLSDQGTTTSMSRFGRLELIREIMQRQPLNQGGHSDEVA